MQYHVLYCSTQFKSYISNRILLERSTHWRPWITIILIAKKHWSWSYSHWWRNGPKRIVLFQEPSSLKSFQIVTRGQQMPGSKVSVHHDDVESLKSGGCASGHQGFFFSRTTPFVQLTVFGSRQCRQKSCCNHFPHLCGVCRTSPPVNVRTLLNTHASTEGPAILFYCGPSQFTRRLM